MKTVDAWLLSGLLGLAWLSPVISPAAAELPAFTPKLHIAQDWQILFGLTDTNGVSSPLRPRLSGQTLFLANDRGEVAALERATGKIRWRRAVPPTQPRIDEERHRVARMHTPPPRQPPTVDFAGGIGGDAQTLVLGTHDGELIALRASNGELRWRIALASEVLAVGGTALGKVVARTTDGKLYAVNVTTGEVEWQVARDTPLLSLRGVGSPDVAERRVIAGFDDGKLLSIATASGDIQWEATLAAPSGRSELERMVDVDGGIATGDNVIYAASYHGRVVAADSRTGYLRWTREIASYTGVSTDERHLYLTAEQGQIFALDRDSGASMWKQDRLAGRHLTRPVPVAEKYLAVADREGFVHWLARRDGRLLARVRVAKAPIKVAPVVHAGVAYVYTGNGWLQALRPVAGAKPTPLAQAAPVCGMAGARSGRRPCP